MQHDLQPRDIAIYGAGGFGRETACLIGLINRQSPQWRVIGFFDDGIAAGEQTGYGPVLGGLDILNSWPTPLSVAIAIGTPQTVRTLTERIKNPNIDFPNLIAPSAVVADPASLKMGRGNLVCGFSWLSCNVVMGDFNLLNGYITVGHDARIGSCNVFMPSCHISGGVEMGNCNFFGLNSAVLQYVKIGSDVRVGAGAIVMRNATKEGSLYMGNPAMRVKF